MHSTKSNFSRRQVVTTIATGGAVWTMRSFSRLVPANDDKLTTSPDRRVFFQKVRSSLFDGRLAQSQVEGLNALLEEAGKWSSLDKHQIAYVLATAFHETGRKMQPIKEYGGASYLKRMYDIEGDRPHIARNLGNLYPGDGVLYAGRGYPQVTGRSNYARISERLGIDFLHNPDLALDGKHASRILFMGMSEGWFTGRKLADYFDEVKHDYRQARRILNGLDKADQIAEYARKFYVCLTAS